MTTKLTDLSSRQLSRAQPSRTEEVAPAAPAAAPRPADAFRSVPGAPSNVNLSSDQGGSTEALPTFVPPEFARLLSRVRAAPEAVEAARETFSFLAHPRSAAEAHTNAPSESGVGDKSHVGDKGHVGDKSYEVGDKGHVGDNGYEVGDKGGVGDKPEVKTAEELQQILSSTPGFLALPPNQQAQFIALLEHPGQGWALCDDTSALVTGAEWSNFTTEEQRDTLSYVLDKARPSHATSLAEGPPASPVEISPPVREGSTDVYQVTVRGMTIPVSMPAMDPPSTTDTGDVYGKHHNHTIEEVAAALSQLPEETLAVIQRVNLSAEPNPDDAYWAQQYNTPDFTSYMTCGAAGVVTIYPLPWEAPTTDMAESLMHEAGHAWSMQQWGTDPSGALWDDWNAAAAADGIYVSDYAANSPKEDVSETSAVYLASRGTPAHDEFRAQFPARFAVLDQVFAEMEQA